MLSQAAAQLGHHACRPDPSRDLERSAEQRAHRDDTGECGQWPRQASECLMMNGSPGDQAREQCRLRDDDRGGREPESGRQQELRASGAGLAQQPAVGARHLPVGRREAIMAGSPRTRAHGSDDA